MVCVWLLSWACFRMWCRLLAWSRSVAHCTGTFQTHCLSMGDTNVWGCSNICISVLPASLCNFCKGQRILTMASREFLNPSTVQKNLMRENITPHKLAVVLFIKEFCLIKAKGNFDSRLWTSRTSTCQFLTLFSHSSSTWTTLNVWRWILLQCWGSS